MIDEYTIKWLERHAEDQENNPHRHFPWKDSYLRHEFLNLCSLCKRPKDDFIWEFDACNEIYYINKQKEKDFDYMLEKMAIKMIYCAEKGVEFK